MGSRLGGSSFELIIFPFLPVGWRLSLGTAQISLLFPKPNAVLSGINDLGAEAAGEFVQDTCF